jgi:hypothetical protein
VLDLSLGGGWAIGRGALFATAEYRNRYETNRAAADPRDQVAPATRATTPWRSRTSLGRFVRAT